MELIVCFTYLNTICFTYLNTMTLYHYTYFLSDGWKLYHTNQMMFVLRPLILRWYLLVNTKHMGEHDCNDGISENDNVGKKADLINF